VALGIGLRSFGGPTAHIGYFRDASVRQRGWIDERTFSELIALTTLLPGPSSSQLGIAIGTVRAGKLGGLAAWIGFTLPSALVMTALGLGVAASTTIDAGLLQGLELVAVAVVLAAIVGMQRTLAPDPARLLVALASTVVALSVSGRGAIPLTVAAAGAIGAALASGVRTIADVEQLDPELADALRDSSTCQQLREETS